MEGVGKGAGKGYGTYLRGEQIAGENARTRPSAWQRLSADA